MRKHAPIFASVALTAFVLAILMACCWQRVITANIQLAKTSHLPACHQQSPEKAQKANPQKPCECPQLLTLIPEKSIWVAAKESGYLKWIFESPSKSKSVILYSFPTVESYIGGPPTRYAVHEPLYIKNATFRI